jgi:uncharacterized metal-binding protein
VGIVACSGEELAEGTVTRLAALEVLERRRPRETVTICLPLFLAGGEGDRAFARYYPTIAVDGCDKRCATRATEFYSSKPAASIVITDIVSEAGLEQPKGLRQLNEAGIQAVEAAADKLVMKVDELLSKRWSRKEGAFSKEEKLKEQQGESQTATCECGSGIPIQTVSINGEQVTLIALHAIFEQFREAERQSTIDTAKMLLEQVKIYNPVPKNQEDDYLEMLHREYSHYLREKVLSI